MQTSESKKINILVAIKAPVEKAWKFWTSPEHITKWNNASDDWHTPKAQNDLRSGGRFVYRMEARDQSMAFDFGGVYEKVELNKSISYTIDDGRKVYVSFESNGDETVINEVFEAENENSIELQRSGWQAILDNFKKYVESN